MEGGRRESGGRDEQKGGGRRFEGVGRGRGGKGGVGLEGGRVKMMEGGGVRGSERRDLLGTVELGGNLNISTQFEEEEEESSSVSQFTNISHDCTSVFTRHHLPLVGY